MPASRTCAGLPEPIRVRVRFRVRVRVRGRVRVRTYAGLPEPQCGRICRRP